MDGTHPRANPRLDPARSPVLVVDDDPTCREILAAQINQLGYPVTRAASATQAAALLSAPDGPCIALLDWVLPDRNGVDLCRELRARPDDRYVYIILVTSKIEKADIVAGLDAGADDFVAKPVHIGELAARIRAGQRLLALQDALDRKVQSLQAALSRVRTLEGLISICMHCKRIRTGEDWTVIEQYIQAHSSALFTHALCTSCLNQHYPEDVPDPSAA